jgi:succinoglycan biosynthesis protein ExoM
MINCKLILKSGYGLEFDQNMAFTGGSDSDFFIRAVKAGAKIVHVSNAIVREEVLENRLTIAWRLKRQYRSSTNRVYINIKLYGYRKAAFYAFKELIRHLIEALLNAVTWPIYAFLGYYKLKRQFYHCLRHLAKAAGNISGLFGIQPQPYQKIDGY